MLTEVEGYEHIKEWLNRQCGFHFSSQKEELLRNRLERVQRRFGFNHLGELADEMRSTKTGEVHSAVVHEASTNHTYFFREPRIFDYFKRNVMPELLRQPTVRIWSAAASSGDEAYTLAMIFASALGPNEAMRRVSILGTDISAPMVELAEQGIYEAKQLRGTPGDYFGMYFRKNVNKNYQVTKQIRSMCMFRRMNLKSNPYPFKMNFHTVFCRNVLYYFNHADQRQVLEAIYDVTIPGGWLVTSVTEPIRGLNTRWTPVVNGIYRKS